MRKVFAKPMTMALLSVAILSLDAAPSPASDDELHATVELLLLKVEEMGARIAQIEDQLEATGLRIPAEQTSVAPMALGDLETRPAHRLAGIGSDPAPSPALARRLEPQVDVESQDEAQAVADASPPDSPSAVLEGEDSPVTASRQGAYLPSRGWREGMHYGSEFYDISVHAFVTAEYVDAGPDGSRSGVSTFDNHHANVFLEAELHPSLIGHTEIEFEHSGDVVEIDQAYFEWGVTDWLSLTAGRFYTPFGIERFVWYSPTNTLVSRPEPMREIVPGNFYANGLMVSGVTATGAEGRFTYEFAISDGLGDSAATSRRGSRQTRDNNSNRALSGRLALAPHRNFEFGTSYHTQRYSSQGDLDLDFFGFDVAARWRRWELRGEYVDAELEQAGPDLDQNGYYLQLGYSWSWLRSFIPQVTLVGRFDSVDLDASVTGNDDRELFSLGLNSIIYDHFRFKVEYRFANEDGPSLDDDTFLGQFVIDF